MSRMQLTVKPDDVDELAQVDGPNNPIGFAHVGVAWTCPLRDRRAGKVIRCSRDPANVRARRRRPRLQSPTGRDRACRDKRLSRAARRR
ncbi:hypothetical protein [Burkholderia pyrrocinia]|uniref:hypothetical protein n=1 Tax=Burkholderia pyrrocinia TaxID=60550 RepID=UPI001BCF89EA|nr:hypothetical protein [Burkholderia pyrrocinia]QVN23112.1 hypothetical protein JYG32_37440 [Burkholderia pyrrocinia]